MRKLIVHMTTGYCGEDAYDVLVVPEDWTDRQIDDETWYMACQHAESYGHPELDPEDGEGEVEAEDEIYSDWMSNHVGNEWEDYDPEKHDMLRSGGGSFEDDFLRLK